jgi:Na+-transporting methylmalonyl-CoA/oxaloacetate decarboxylase gamma subunit
MSKGVISVLSFLAIFIIGGPIAKSLGSHGPLVGIAVGAIVFVVLSILFAARK